MGESKTQFDATVNAYENSMGEMPLRKYVEAFTFRHAIGDVRGLSVLDMGCGSGLFTRELKTAGAREVVGVDESEPMIAYAQRREEEEQLGIRFRTGNVTEALQDLEGRFDLVTAVYMLPYARTAKDLTAMCGTARRALHPGVGGRFVTYTINPDLSATAERYQPYGLAPTLPEPRCDGKPGRLRARFGEHTLDLEFFYWSRAAQEEAMRQAGFTRFTWIDPQVSSEGAARFGEQFWSAYLNCPHALILEAH
ncbi:class I SAM-dependent methyltransferase [Streptomyces sp. NPDC060286]|uniref:class I SAM-dependent methyltransferase n=1 Tax=unclassified Streptomyces TaxID=2593676 RepID=UPI0035D91069